MEADAYAANVSDIIVWSSGISSNRNQSVGIYAWIIRMG